MKFKPVVLSEISTEYNPPVPDFAVMKHVIKTGETVKLPKKESASIILVTEGSGKYSVQETGKAKDFSCGAVLFLGSNEELDVSNSGASQIVMFQAFC